MTLRRLWLMILTGVVILSVVVNGWILTVLTNRYFKDYLQQSYDEHTNQIIHYTTAAVTDQDITPKQMAARLESHLIDPIIRIKYYDVQGNLLVDVKDNLYYPQSMMGGSHRGMGNHDSQNRMQEYYNESDDVDGFVIESGGEAIGMLNITRHTSAGNTAVAKHFKDRLWTNSLLSVSIALGIAIVIGIFVSKWMAMSLRETSELATRIRQGEPSHYKPTFIYEIQQIRESMDALSQRLRLKQKSRKSLTDQLVHQTRTPLTILKSHLEGIEDGIIDMDAEEMRIWQQQIENLNLIINNMSGMIDTEGEATPLTYTKVDVHTLMEQMRMSLKPQFDKKHIQFHMTLTGNNSIYTDVYKLRQVLYNLLINAYKYTESGGQVWFKGWFDANTVHFLVEDTGIGMDGKTLERLFEAYYRSDDVMHIPGEGIGLYLVKETTTQISGNIVVESKKGVGSRFEIIMPLEVEPDHIQLDNVKQ